MLGEYSYINKFSGKKFDFRPLAGLRVVTFDPAQVTEVISDLVRQGYSVITAESRLNRGVLVATGADVEPPILSAALVNSVPVLVDQEGCVHHFLPGEVTVQFRPEVKKSKVNDLIRSLGSEVVSKQRTPGYYTLSVPEGQDLFESIRAYSELPEVTFAEPSEFAPDDRLKVAVGDSELFPVLWGLENMGQRVAGALGKRRADIRAVKAWTISEGDPTVLVVVIDTGIDLGHPNLVGNLLARGNENWNFAEPGKPDPADDDGHGTGIAGTVAAAQIGKGTVGVAPKCKIMPLKVSLEYGKYQDRVDAINYAAEYAERHRNYRFVVNLSWMTGGDHSGIHSAIKRSVDADMVVVCAAGNKGLDLGNVPSYPAMYEEVIAVAATDQVDVKAGFSNFGKRIDLSAPGVNVYTTDLGGSYQFQNGTSCSAAYVSGVAALIRSHVPDLSSSGVRTSLQNGCDRLKASGPYPIGKGRINARSALLASR